MALCDKVNRYQTARRHIPYHYIISTKHKNSWTVVTIIIILGKWPTWCTILLYVFISILCMYRATSCPSSGESIVSTQPLVYVTLYRWSFRVHVGKFLSDLHTKRPPIQSDIYQRLCWYNWFSWWWARCCSKHVENWNKYTKKNCASSWSFT